MYDYEAIVKLLDLTDDEIYAKYQHWERDDGSSVGLAEILVFQYALASKFNDGDDYDGAYDHILNPPARRTVTEHKAP